MTERIVLSRDRYERLAEEEVKLAKALRGKLPPDYFKLDERRLPNQRSWINFYFEYFMTYHINSFKLSNKLWCDGADIITIKRRKNTYILSGYLYLLPEDETGSHLWSFIETWDKFPFTGSIILRQSSDSIKSYNFKIQLDDLAINCRRKYNKNLKRTKIKSNFRRLSGCYV
jgi:hypothetical protein